MATGQSFSNLSDEYHDFPCYSCDQEGRNIPAVKFCVDCNRLFCSTCLGHHNKFEFMKGHQLLEKTAFCRQRRKDKPALATFRCDKHEGKILEIFCKTHNEACCTVCAALDHSACTEKGYLPDIARSSFKEGGLRELKTSAEKLIHGLEKAKQKRISALKDMSGQKAYILDEINEKRSAINQRFDAMEKDVKMKLDKKFTEYSNDLTTEIENVEEYVKTMEKYEEESGSSHQNESDAFIILKKLEQCVIKGPQFEKGLSTTTHTLRLVEKCSVSNVLEAIGSDVFGYVSGDGEIESVVLAPDSNIKAPDDTTASCISDSCLMEDGTIILTDQNNKKLKRLDKAFQLRDSLMLPGKPCAVCPTSTSEVAVSLLSNKTIQFVRIENRMSVTGSFKIGESCRGIAFYNDQLYLSCGGMSNYQDGTGEVRIYDKSGNIIRKTDKEAGIPKRMSIGTKKPHVDIFITDEEKGVLCLNTSGSRVEIKNIFMNKDMKAAVGICYTGRGEIVVAGYDSNNVILISDTGTFIKEILSQKHGVVKPKSLCLDQTGSKLLLGMTDVDFIKVVQLIRK